MAVCAQCGRENAADARFCSGCGAPLGSDGPPDERRKVVTVLFTDLVGSTSLGEGLDPEAVRRVMSRYFDAMRAVVERHGGTVEKFIGDAIMAVFGIPTLHEDDALRAVSRGRRDARRARGAERDARTRAEDPPHHAHGRQHRRGRGGRRRRPPAACDRRCRERRRAARAGRRAGRDPARGDDVSARARERSRGGRRAARTQRQEPCRWRRGSSSKSCRTFLPSRGRSRRRSSGARKSLRHSEQRSIRLRERKHA